MLLFRSVEWQECKLEMSTKEQKKVISFSDCISLWQGDE